jgi:hypothetical protein
MSDTPETDAAIKAQAEWMRPFVSTTMDGVTYDGPVAALCRKLERERDEARFLLQASQSALDAIHLEVAGWIKIIKEKTY